MLGALGPRLAGRVLAEEIVVVGRGERRVRVGRTDHAELVRVHAQLLLELQAGLQRRARVFALQHVGLLALAQVEIALVPELEAGEFVILATGRGAPRRRP